MNSSLYECFYKQPVRLSHDTVNVWIIDTDAKHKVCAEHYSGLLSEDEKNKVASFQSSARRRQFIIARAGLRLILARCMPGSPPESFRFTTNEFHKPELADNPSKLRFNVSHSRNMIAIGVSKQSLVGVDIECINDKRDVNKIASHCFHSNEWDNKVLATLKTKEKIRRYFYALWTLKEAFLKAQGTGLTQPLDSFWFSLKNSALATGFSADGRELPWYFWQYCLPGQFRLAVALEALTQHAPSITFHQING